MLLLLLTGRVRGCLQRLNGRWPLRDPIMSHQCILGVTIWNKRGKHRCNVWQGDFPTKNTVDDGYEWTAPVTAYRRQEGGFYNLIGNVWEWCSDWFSPSWHCTENQFTRINPSGPQSGENKVIKGGSFLCHDSYCNRYRLGARTANAPESATTNLGFRCARDA